MKNGQLSRCILSSGETTSERGGQTTVVVKKEDIPTGVSKDLE